MAIREVEKAFIKGFPRVWLKLRGALRIIKEGVGKREDLAIKLL